MECAAWLAGWGNVCVQLNYALVETSTPPAVEATSYNTEPIGGYSGRPPLDGFVRGHPRPPCRGVNSGVTGAHIPFYANDAAFDGL